MARIERHQRSGPQAPEHAQAVLNQPAVEALEVDQGADQRGLVGAHAAASSQARSRSGVATEIVILTLVCFTAVIVYLVNRGPGPQADDAAQRSTARRPPALPVLSVDTAAPTGGGVREGLADLRPLRLHWSIAERRSPKTTRYEGPERRAALLFD